MPSRVELLMLERRQAAAAKNLERVREINATLSELARQAQVPAARAAKRISAAQETR